MKVIVFSHINKKKKEIIYQNEARERKAKEECPPSFAFFVSCKKMSLTFHFIPSLKSPNGPFFVHEFCSCYSF